MWQSSLWPFQPDEVQGEVNRIHLPPGVAQTPPSGLLKAPLVALLVGKAVPVPVYEVRAAPLDVADLHAWDHTMELCRAGQLPDALHRLKALPCGQARPSEQAGVFVSTPPPPGNCPAQ